MSGSPSAAQGAQTGAFYLPRNLVILPSPTPHTTSFQLKCFLPPLPNIFVLVAFVAQYYKKVSFQQNACDYQIAKWLTVVYNLAVSKIAHLNRT